MKRRRLLMTAWVGLGIVSLMAILLVEGSAENGKRQVALLGTPVLLFGLTTTLVILDRALDVKGSAIRRRFSVLAATILLLGVLVMIVAFIGLIS